MFCNNCGKEVPDGDMFCQHCGAKVGQETPVEPVQSEVVPPQKTPKKFGKKIWVPIVSVIGVLAVSVGVAFAHPVGRNFLTKLVMSPEKYFEHSLTKNAKGLTDDLYASINSFKGLGFKEGGAEGEMKVEFGEGFKDVIEEAAGDEAAYITWIDSFGADFDVAVSKKGLSGDFTYKINDSKITTVELDEDLENFIAYYRFPDINDEALKVDFSETFEEAGMGELMSILGNISKELDKIYGLIPEQKVVEDIFVRYAKVIAGEIKDVEEETEKIEIEGVTQKCTVLTAEIDGDVLLSMAKGVLEEVKDDEDIEDIIKDFMSAYNVDEGNYDNFVESINNALDNFPDEIEENISFDVKLYVNNKGEIVGFGVEVQGAEISFITLEKGSKKAIEFKVEAPGANIAFSGMEEENGGKVSGEYTLKANSMELISVKTSGVDVEKAKNGVFVGNMTIEAGKGISDLMDMMGGRSEMADVIDVISSLKLELTATDTSGKLSVYAKDKMFIAMTVDAKENSNTKLTFPDSYVTVTDASDMESWLSGCSIDGLLSNLKDADLPGELASELEQSYAESQVSNGAMMDEYSGMQYTPDELRYLAHGMIMEQEYIGKASGIYDNY